MKVDLSHVKNPTIGWDVVVKATADAGEKLAWAAVTVNGATVADESLDGLSSWTRTLRQQGFFPGRNTVKAEITNDKGEGTAAEDSWE